MIPEDATPPTPIDPRLWQAAEQLFHAALDYPEEERQAFLDAAAEGDEALRSEVASLLAALDAPEAFSEQAATELAADLTEGSPSTPTDAVDTANATAFPERLGPYRLLEVLGEGGMSTVYLAEQCEPLPRRVALKLMRWGGMHGETLRRFELERETLARMNHPNIAQVFGAGATEHGQPYVVIEHVPGPPITTYCDERRLSIEQRLKLFVAVCHGVLHAHEKAVIHRDLKPSNILVTEVHGQALPKIIDFGIAKSLEPWSDSAAHATRSQLRVGSPGYMSPEAILEGGRGVDTRSDVYSLGVVLCQLLVGVRPFKASGALLFSALSRGEKTDPPRPSQRFTALSDEKRRETAQQRGTNESRLLRHLRGDLDWIVLRAIAPDPAARYGSPRELAADVDAWLTDRPITARPPSFVYRARKTARRHAVALLVTASIAALLVGFSIRTNSLYQEAQTARLEAEELVDFMLDDLSTQLEPIGQLDLLESVARRSLAYFESGATGGLDRPGRHPAAALRQVGQVLASRGDFDAARNAYERALDIDRELHRLQPSAPQTRLALAHDLELLGHLHQRQGEWVRAAALMAEAEWLLRDLLPRPDAQIALARTLQQRAALERSRGHTEEARARFAEALSILQGLWAERPDAVDIRHQMAEVHYGSGLLEFHWLDNAEAAAREFESGAAIFQEISAGQPGASLWRYRLGVLKGQGLTTAYSSLDRLEDARDANREALSHFETLVRDQPDNSRWAFALGWELIRRSELAIRSGELDTAAEALRRSIEVQSALLERATGQPDIAWLDGLATAHEKLAEVETQRGRFTEALAAAEAMLKVRQQVVRISQDLAFDHTKLATAGVLVGELRQKLGDTSGSLGALAEAKTTLETLEAMTVEEPAVSKELASTRERAEQLARTLGS